MQESGRMPMGFDICLDAKAVSDALEADEPQVPAEVRPAQRSEACGPSE